MEASETTTTPDAPQEGQPQETPDAPSGDLQEQIDALKERVDQSPSPAPTPTQPADLAAALAGGEPEPEPDEEYEGFGGEADLYQPEAEEFQSADELNAYLQERDDRLTNLEAQYAADAENRNLAELEALTEKYPQLKDEAHVAKVRDILQPLAEQRGDPNLVLDPRLVELTHKSLMADEASASEVPAEEAANQGASLETGAGPGNLEQETSYSDDAGDAIVAAGRLKKSAFS